MIKRLTFILALVLVCASVLTACESKISDVTGTTWVLSSATSVDGQEVTSEMIEQFLGEITYEFKEDGVVIVSASGKSGEASWSQDGDEITISGNGTTAVARLDDSRITMEIEGNSMVFNKK